MYDTGFDKAMFAFLAVLATFVVLAVGFGLLAGLWTIWQATKLGAVATVGGGYASVRWLTLPMYRAIKENI